MPAAIAIIDYKKGNLASVRRGFADAGFDAFVTDDPEKVAVADGIVLPGVGAFSDAARMMIELGLMAAIRKRVNEGVPFLGICLGLQLMMEEGDEGSDAMHATPGLGLIAGRVEPMASKDDKGTTYKIPHVGWNCVDFVGDGGPLLEGIKDGTYFYFTHSYCVHPYDKSCIIATTTHAKPFVSVVQKDKIFGVQWHPEKSSTAGLRVLVNFGHIVEAAAT